MDEALLFDEHVRHHTIADFVLSEKNSFKAMKVCSAECYDGYKDISELEILKHLAQKFPVT